MTLQVKFWGTRGSIPSPGKATLRYGGNTSCVEVLYGNHSLIVDGGTGIRLLGKSLSRKSRKPVSILISHTHMDHIAGIPFFAPALNNGRSIRIYGPPGLKKSLQHLFPFPRLQSKKTIFEIKPRSFRISPFTVDCRWVNHPGGSLGYKIRTPGGHSVVYISDHEPVTYCRHGSWAPSDREMIQWIDRPDLLIMDAQYFEAEYKKRKGWGHSSLSYTVRLALQSGARKLCLFHHDPNHSDPMLKRKLAHALEIINREGGRISCSLSQEGTTITLSP
ncbi:MAG: MBL fold metallo-hydrolase [Deltaproteobacteria bacterium]|nr:MBL fold metallo-hydrolase [Deltaproteobacteria bacterium]